MPWGIDTVKDLVGLVSSLAIIISVVAYFLSKKQFQFNVMVKCIDRFQVLLPSLESIDQKQPEERTRIMRQYIDLCEEELFYFEKGYLPKDIRGEWIEGMLNYLPLYEKGKIDKLLNDDYKLKEIEKNSLLDGYPRIHRCFGYKEQKRTSANKELVKLIEKRL